jgi:hypothetical protein
LTELLNLQEGHCAHIPNEIDKTTSYFTNRLENSMKVSLSERCYFVLKVALIGGTVAAVWILICLRTSLCDWMPSFFKVDFALSVWAFAVGYFTTSAIPRCSTTKSRSVD